MPPPLDRAAKANRFAVFGDRAPGKVEALFLQQIDQRIVRQDCLGILGIDQRLDRGFDRAGRSTAFAIDRANARGKEVYY